MMGTTSPQAALGAADSFLKLLDLIADPDKAREMAQDLRNGAAAYETAQRAAADAQKAAEQAQTAAREAEATARTAESDAQEALAKLRDRDRQADEKATITKGEIAADRQALKQERAEAKAAHDREMTSISVAQAALDGRAKALTDGEAALAGRERAVMEREEVLKKAEADYAERIGKLKQLAG